MSNLKSLIKSQDKKRFVAYLGSYAGIVETGKPGELYARLVNGKEIRINNKLAPPIHDLPVIAIYQDGFYEVAGVRESYTWPSHGINHAENKPDSFYCSYCGSKWIEDRRGNCSACGAPLHV